MILIEILIFDSSQKVSRGNSTHPWLPIFGDDDFDVYFFPWFFTKGVKRQFYSLGFQLDRSQSLFNFVPQENLTVKLARLLPVPSDDDFDFK